MKPAVRRVRPPDPPGPGRILRRTLPFWFCAALVGCTHLPAPRLPQLDEASVRSLCLSVLARSEEIRTHITDARIILKSRAGRTRFRQVSMLVRPASIRFEILDPFGRAVFLLVSDGEQLTAFDPLEGLCAVGPAGPDSFSRFLPIAIGAEELIDLLAGAPAPDCREPSAERAEEGLHRFRAGRREGAGAQRIWIDPEGGACRKVELFDAGGSLELIGEFSELEQAGGLTLPKRVRLTAQEAPGDALPGEVELLFEYAEVTVNRPVDATLFTFTPPPSAKIVDLEKSPEVAIP